MSRFGLDRRLRPAYRQAPLHMVMYTGHSSTDVSMPARTRRISRDVTPTHPSRSASTDPRLRRMRSRVRIRGSPPRCVRRLRPIRVVPCVTVNVSAIGIDTTPARWVGERHVMDRYTRHEREERKIESFLYLSLSRFPFFFCIRPLTLSHDRHDTCISYTSHPLLISFLLYLSSLFDPFSFLIYANHLHLLNVRTEPK